MEHYKSYNGRSGTARRRRDRERKRRRKSGTTGIRLAVCVALFAAASLLRVLFPAEAARLGEKLNRACDLRSAFTVLGEGFSGKREMKEALGDAWRFVFVPAEREDAHVMAPEPEGTPVDDAAETSDVPAFAAEPQAPAETPVQPVDGRVLRRFGYDPESAEPVFHYGTEVEAASGTPVLSMLSGTVTAVGESRTKGSYLVVVSGDAETEYSGLGRILASSGDRVQAGDAVAEAGDGPVRIEVLTDAGYIDPEEWIHWS